MFKDLFEAEAVLKSIFIAKAYETGFNDVWNKLYLMQDWTNLLRQEKRILSKINRIPPTKLTWLDLVNLYGYMIGEQVFTMREFGLAKYLSKLSGNHPYNFVLATLKGFDKAIEKGGSLTSYYATYAIEGICTFSYVTLRNHKTRDEIRRELLNELNQPLADQDVVFKDKEAIRQIRILEKTLKNMGSIALDEFNTCTVLKHVKAIISDILPSINKWIYLTYAKTSKEHGRAITRMSTRFSFAVLLSPEFKINENGEIKVERFPIFEPIMMSRPKEETSSFINTCILPKIENGEYKKLISQSLTPHWNIENRELKRR
jgi:hypothetical protein